MNSLKDIGFYNKQPIRVVVSVGVTRDLFNTRRKTENANGSVTVDRSRILIMYGNIEGGVTYPLLSKTKFPLFSALSFRMSRALKENYSNVYVHEPGSDMGLNFKIGHKFDYGKARLYLQLNYYQGLLKLARNNVLTSNGAQDSFIQNKSLGFQIGVVPLFKKRWSPVE